MLHIRLKSKRLITCFEARPYRALALVYIIFVAVRWALVRASGELPFIMTDELQLQ